MIRLAFAAVLIAAVGCARNPYPHVSVLSETGPVRQPMPAVTMGRAAGAGGSHAPGSTGLGAGTLGADPTAEAGSGR